MLRTSNQLTLEEFNLFNPAYCGLLVYRAVASSPHGVPSGLFYLILPFVLTEAISSSLPRATSTSFLYWYNNNQDVLLDIGKRTQSFIDISHDALDFLLLHNAIDIDSNGTLQIKSHKVPASSKKIKASSIISLHVKAANLFGRWVAHQNQATIYALLGIRP